MVSACAAAWARADSSIRALAMDSLPFSVASMALALPLRSNLRPRGMEVPYQRFSITKM